MHQVPIQQGPIGFIVGILALTRVGVEQLACLDVVILYGGRKENVQTRVRSSQVLPICTRPAVFSAAERTFARHGGRCSVDRGALRRSRFDCKAMIFQVLTTAHVDPM